MNNKEEMIVRYAHTGQESKINPNQFLKYVLKIGIAFDIDLLLNLNANLFS